MTLRFSAFVALLIGANAYGDPPDVPFVAGFERFGRSGAVSTQTAGRLLLEELRCANCHSGNQSPANPGPDLSGVGNRLQRDWLMSFLSDPAKVKPGTLMPNVLHGVSGKEKAATIEALSAFLSNQRAPFRKLKSDARNPIPHEFWLKGDASRGRKLYHQTGCVACHEPDADYDVPPRIPSPLEKLLSQLSPAEIKKLNVPLPPRPVKSVPHGDLATKYTRRSLTFFLMNPEATRPHSAMPNFQLNPGEAAEITEYLLRGQPANAKAMAVVKEKKLIDRGRLLFVKLGCNQCHTVKALGRNKDRSSLAKLNFDAKRSCVRNPRAAIPRYDLDKKQREALQVAMTGKRRDEKGLPVSRRISFALLQLNCYACHRRDKLGGIPTDRQGYFETIGHVDIGDEGKLPPSLGQVGAKLKIDALNRILAGTGSIRPFMTVKMPRFPSHRVRSLPTWFAEADARALRDKSITSVPKLAKIGRSLINDAGCLQCHSLRGESLPGVVGVDIADTGKRLHAGWFRDFLLKPAKRKPGTRMPTFFPGGKSQFPDILDGDEERQITAMWTYLNEATRHPLPDKLASAKVKNFEIVPTNKPILLRTFMKQAGPMAIAVGFPQKIHFAFDAQDVRLAVAWRGRFLDAHGTWFNRLAPPAVPLGSDVIAFPAGAPLVMPNGKSPAYRFRGYRLDAKGIPTFLYEYGALSVEDRLTPGPKRSLRRTLRIKRNTGKGGGVVRVVFRAHAGSKLVKMDKRTIRNESGLSTTTSIAGEVVRKGKRTEFHVPLEIRGETVIEVHYEW